MNPSIAEANTGREPRAVFGAHEGARVFPVPPPLLYAVPMAVGLAIDRVVPLTITAPGGQVAGAVLVVAGVGVVLAGVAAVVRHKTTIVPHRAVSTLVTDGVYRLSRNPMYAGLAVAYVGVSLLARSLWPLAFLLPALVLVRRLVIGPEERYLRTHFGEHFDAYRSRVRRWI